MADEPRIDPAKKMQRLMEDFQKMPKPEDLPEPPPPMRPVGLGPENPQPPVKMPPTMPRRTH